MVIADIASDRARLLANAAVAQYQIGGLRHALASWERALLLFERPDDGRHWLSHRVHTVPLDGRVLDQCEGLAWDGWSLLVTNERRDVFRIADPFRAAAFP